MPYEPVYLEAYDWEDRKIYHTDCLLTLVHDHALLCSEALKNPEIKERAITALTMKKKSYKIIDLSYEEVKSMCANTQALYDQAGNKCLIMSDRAYRSYRKENLKQLKSNLKLIVTNVDLIEFVGGGSCRCMTSEEYAAPISSPVSSFESSQDLGKFMFANEPRPSTATMMNTPRQSASITQTVGLKRKFKNNDEFLFERSSKRQKVDEF